MTAAVWTMWTKNLNILKSHTPPLMFLTNPLVWHFRTRHAKDLIFRESPAFFQSVSDLLFFMTYCVPKPNSRASFVQRGEESRESISKAGMLLLLQPHLVSNTCFLPHIKIFPCETLKDFLISWLYMTGNFLYTLPCWAFRNMSVTLVGNTKSTVSLANRWPF